MGRKHKSHAKSKDTTSPKSVEIKTLPSTLPSTKPEKTEPTTSPKSIKIKSTTSPKFVVIKSPRKEHIKMEERTPKIVGVGKPTKKGAWQRFMEMNIVKSSVKTYDGWKTSSLAVSTGINMMETGVKLVLNPVTSTLSTLKKKYPETASRIDNLAVSCLDKADVAIQKTSNAIASKDLKKTAGRFVIACLDDFIEAAEHTLDMVSPDVKLTPGLKAIDSTTQTTEGASQEEKKAEKVIRPTPVSVTLMVQEMSLITKFRQLLTVPLSTVIRILKYISGWLKSSIACDKSTSTSSSPEKAWKTSHEKKTITEVVLYRLQYVYGSTLSVLKFLGDFFYRWQRNIRQRVFPTAGKRRKDGEKRKYSDIASDESDSDICDINNDLEDYNSEEDTDWQPGVKDMQILKKDLDESLEYKPDAECPDELLEGQEHNEGKIDSATGESKKEKVPPPSDTQSGTLVNGN